MKIILSRKGFDSNFGGCASPILPDGTMLSMPIPVDDDSSGIAYSDISFEGRSYAEYLRQFNPKRNYTNCHLDPDIRADIRTAPVENWKAAFGQIDASQTHLKNQGVTSGDLFLFFGWYKETQTDINGNLQYIRDASDIHAIFGYLQIGAIISGEAISEYFWHPHSDVDHVIPKSNNTLYLASDELILDGEKTGMPGYGIFRFSEKLVLTKQGETRSRWKLLDWMTAGGTISHHSKNSVKDGYFQSVPIGQEFVISDNDSAVAWAKTIILG